MPAGLPPRAALRAPRPHEPPHIIVFPEIPFVPADFLARVKQCVSDYGYCVAVVSEGAAYADGRFVADAGTKDAFGHTQLGGVAPVIANMIREAHGYKYHWAVADYLQRAARHVASRVDVEQAYAVGKAAVELAVKGVNAVMPTIVRRSSRPYRWTIGHVPLAQVANVEKKVPRSISSPQTASASPPPAAAISSRSSAARHRRPTVMACPSMCGLRVSRCGASSRLNSSSERRSRPSGRERHAIVRNRMAAGRTSEWAGLAERTPNK